VRILSTHNGDDSPFNELIKEIKEGKQDYSLHRTTFDDALAQGLYKRICLVGKQAWSPEAQEAWRKEIVDKYRDAADEELFCIPVRAGTRYFPSALLEAATDNSAAVMRKSCEDSFTFEKEEKRIKEFDKWLKREVRDILLAHTNPVYLGEDFARSGDLTCIFLDEEMPDGRMLTFFVIELRNVPFAQQWQVIKYVMDTLPNLGSAAFDSRGNGQMIAELAAQEWPGYVYQVMITAKWYSENFPGLKGNMEDGTTNIPGDPFIRDDFRVVGLKAGVPCVLERSGGPRERRHGDGAIAKLMAFYAAKEDDAKGYQPMTYEAVETANRYRQGSKDIWDD
jgi:phage FluMu gp28-like protein